MIFTPDGQSLIYYHTADKQLHIWDITTQSETVMDASAIILALSPDGSTLVWGGAGDDGEVIWTAPLDALDRAQVIYSVPDTLKIASRVTWMDFTPDGSQVVIGGFFASDHENQIVVLDVE